MVIDDDEQMYTARISPSNRPTPDGWVSSLDIPTSATVIVRPSYPPSPISPKRLIRSHKLWRRLRWGCYGWREVRGDGNCYYRAIYFSILERAIGRMESAAVTLAGLYDKFKEVEDTLLATYSFEVIEDYNQLMEDLEQRRSMYDSVLEFEDYLISNPRIEIAYICIMRAITGRILLTSEMLTSEQVQQIKYSYGFTDEDNDAHWPQKVWFREIAPLGKEAEGPLVHLSSISTFLDSGCQLLLSTDNGGIHVVGNGLHDARISTAIILHQEHYDIIYRRIFGPDESVFEDLGEADPVNQNFSYTPLGSDGSPPLQSWDEEEDPTLEYTEHPD
jgi:hypothetical protein